MTRNNIRKLLLREMLGDEAPANEVAVMMRLFGDASETTKLKYKELLLQATEQHLPRVTNDEQIESLGYLMNQNINEDTDGDFPVWGVPPTGGMEVLLFSAAKSYKEAEKVKEILEKKHKCTNLRIGSVDMDTPPDFARTVN